MGSDGKKIFIISLDGATFSVLNPLMKQGCMPNLSALMSQGVSAELESVVPPVTAPAWSSFMTGKHPNKHGILDFARFDPARYKWSINNAQNIRSTTLWQILSEKGKRVVVLNLPYTYPPYQVNGVLVSGWDAPLTDAAFSYPPEIGSEILRSFPDYRENLWVSELQPLGSDDHFDQFIRKLKTGFEQQARIAMDLLAKNSWDVFMVHFQQTDWIQHKLWTYIEHGCKYPNDRTPKIEATRQCYSHFDDFVGRLFKQVKPFQATTILLSDHGFGRLMGNIHPNFHLKQWGYLSVLPEAEDRLLAVKSVLRESPYPAVRTLYRSLTAAKNWFRKGGEAGEGHDSWADNAEDVMGARGATWDWSRTRAAMVYAYQIGFIYLNRIGSGPRGIVRPGNESESIVADLIARFREIRHPHTGERLLQDAVRGTSIYPVAENDVLIPDVVLFPVDGYNFSFSLTDAAPKVTEEGTHRHNGVLAIQGEAIRNPVSNFCPSLVDLTPTILHLLGLPVPSDMDGTVWEQILSTDWSVQYEDVDNSVQRVAGQYAQKDADIVAQRLRGLGYLD